MLDKPKLVRGLFIGRRIPVVADFTVAVSVMTATMTIGTWAGTAWTWSAMMFAGGAARSWTMMTILARVEIAVAMERALLTIRTSTLVAMLAMMSTVGTNRPPNAWHPCRGRSHHVGQSHPRIRGQHRNQGRRETRRRTTEAAELAVAALAVLMVSPAAETMMMAMLTTAMHSTVETGGSMMTLGTESTVMFAE